MPKKKLYWTLDSWRWGRYVVSKRQDPIAQWRNVISQKNGIVGCTPAETSKLTHVFFVLFKPDVTEALTWLPYRLWIRISTDMRRLTTGIRSEKCVVRRFRRCANVYLHKPR